VSKPFIALLAALAAISMIVAGCGGGDDSTDSTASSDSSGLTKAEFLKQGNAICAKGEKELNEEFEKFAEEENLSENKPPTEAQLAKATEEFFLPIIKEQVEGVAALSPPAGEEQQVDKVVSAAEAAIEEAEEDPGSLANEKEDPFAEANELATEYGLTKCGE
jgi:uncharacterized Zn finger protein